jgi:hypothetical protein
VGVLFKRPGEEDESEESEAEQVGPTLSMTAAEEMIEPPSVAQEAPIVIHDD